MSEVQIDQTSGVPDWSTVHKPVGDLFEHVTLDKSAFEKFKLTNEQIEQFWRDGFLLNIQVLTHEQCDKIIEDYRYFLGGEKHPGMNMLYEYHSNQSGDPDNVLMHALGHWRLTKHFHDLVFLPEVVVHIALDDQSEENGALNYIPGSHRWTRNGGKPLPVTDFNFKDMESIKTILTEEEKAQFKPLCGNLKKGEASFHHPLSVHGSYGNRSNRPRRAAVLNYFQDGVCSDTDEETLKGILIPKDHKMNGQFFPLVFNVEQIR